MYKFGTKYKRPRTFSYFNSGNRKSEKKVLKDTQFPLAIGRRKKIQRLKTVAFIAGKSENQAAQKTFYSFFHLIANISLYALSWPKLNFGSFEIIFKL